MAEDWWLPKDISPEMRELLLRRMEAAEAQFREVLRPHIEALLNNSSSPLLDPSFLEDADG